jgi:hypothetical protein
MNIAFIHYHLKPGGVTRVIQQQIGICQQAGWNYCIIAGENPTGLPNFIKLPELHYDLHRSGLPDDERCRAPAEQLADQIQQAAESWFAADSGPAIRGKAAGSTGEPGLSDKAADSAGKPAPTIYHIHNATLAKNSDLLPAIHVLIARRLRIFLQLHDFAEDGRPTVYSSSPYPLQAHYGAINSRDRDYLAGAGVPAARLHDIPNLVSPLPGAVAPEEDGPAGGPVGAGNTAGKLAGKPAGTADTEQTPAPGAVSRDRQQLALYPVRAIRRKNVGEALLLSLLLPDTDVAITLPPNNPVDMPVYEYWRDLAARIDAPVEFDIAHRLSFEDAVTRADWFLTTSVQEGFGFAFLEPWTLQKAVAGRTVPYVQRDFEASGMTFPWFYRELPVPVEYIDMEGFRRLWLDEAGRRLSRFRIALRNQALNRAATRTQQITTELESHFDRLYGRSATIDFARLDPDNQALVIRGAADDEQLRQQLRSAAPVLSALPPDGPAVDSNYRAVYHAYGEASYRKRMEAIYSSLAGDRQLFAGAGTGGSTPAGFPANPDAGGAPEGGDVVMDKEALLFMYLDPASMYLITSLNPGG